MKGTTEKIIYKKGGSLVSLIRIDLPLLKNAYTRMAKIVLSPLWVAEAASAPDTAIQEKIYGLGMTTMIISNEQMKDILKEVTYLEESGLLVKGTSKTIANEAQEQKGGFFPLLLGTLGASLLGNVLAGKRVIQAGEREPAPSQEQGTIRAGQDV